MEISNFSSHKLRRLGIPDSIWARLFLFVVVLEGIAVTILETVIIISHSEQFARVHATNSQYKYLQNDYEIMLMYDILFVVGQLFLFIVSWEGLAHKNTIQVIFSTAFNFTLFLFQLLRLLLSLIIVNRPGFALSMNPGFQAYFIGLVSVIGFSTVALGFLTWELILDFGWIIYKKLGADLKIRSMYKVHQVMVTLLKFDVYYMISFSVQLVLLFLQQRPLEAWISVGLLIPGTTVFLVLAFVAVYQERRVQMRIVLVVLCIMPVYYITQAIRMFVGGSDTWIIYSHSYIIFLCSVVITVTITLVTFVTGIMCYRNFGNGLSEAIAAYYQGKGKPEKASPTSSFSICGSTTERKDYYGARLQLE